MPDPGDVGRQGIKTGIFYQLQAVFPFFNRGSVIVEFSSMDQLGLVVDPKVAIFDFKLAHFILLLVP
jgi:hypothetical protein